MKTTEDQRVTNVHRSLAASVARLALADRRTLVAASGGADSTCLLVGLHRLGVAVEGAYIDHGLRPGAAAEATLVERLCADLGVAFHHRRIEVHLGSGLEARARAARYAALESLRVARGLAAVATGHTASDQAETLLMRLGRGAALLGAGGIQEERVDGVVRPLLGVLRDETRAYVAALGLEVASDPMNDDLAFTRVRVRREVLPRLSEALGPGAERALARFARLAQEDDALLASLATQALQRALLGDGGLDRVAVLTLERPVQRRVLAQYLEQASVPLDAAVIEGGLAALRLGVPTPLPRDLLLTTRGGVVRVEPAPPRSGGKPRLAERGA